mmetsp:Transcript_50334/g.129654  ORF Transcript_50334/g.129654 Transcript_50334/m.129654 type:complete len:450 (-) Transcript_50334:310-1659(-)
MSRLLQFGNSSQNEGKNEEGNEAKRRRKVYKYTPFWWKLATIASKRIEGKHAISQLLRRREWERVSHRDLCTSFLAGGSEVIVEEGAWAQDSTAAFLVAQRESFQTMCMRKRGHYCVGTSKGNVVLFNQNENGGFDEAKQLSTSFTGGIHYLQRGNADTKLHLLGSSHNGVSMETLDLSGSGKPMRSYVLKDSARAMKGVSCGTFLSVCDSRGGMHLFDERKKKSIMTFLPPSAPDHVTSISPVRDAATTLAVATRAEAVQLWDLRKAMAAKTVANFGRRDQVLAKVHLETGASTGEHVAHTSLFQPVYRQGGVWAVDGKGNMHDVDMDKGVVRATFREVTKSSLFGVHDSMLTYCEGMGAIVVASPDGHLSFFSPFSASNSIAVVNDKVVQKKIVPLRSGSNPTYLSIVPCQQEDMVLALTEDALLLASLRSPPPSALPSPTSASPSS